MTKRWKFSDQFKIKIAREKLRDDPRDCSEAQGASELVVHMEKVGG